MARTAVFVPNNFQEKEPLPLDGLYEIESQDDPYYFSVMGRSKTPSQDPANHSSIYVPLNSTFKRAIITPDFPALYDNDFTCSWILSLFQEMGDNSEVVIGIKSEKRNIANRWLSRQTIQKRFPFMKVKAITKDELQFIRIAPKTSPNGHSYPSIYPYFHNSFSAFSQAYSNAKYNGNGRSVNLEKEAWETFLYSLFGANQKTYILEKIIEDYFSGQKINAMDLGGGYGFMAAELAAKGHSMTVMDVQQFQMEVCRWLTKRCRLENHLQCNVSKIEDAKADPGSLDLVSYFGCLLYLDRPHIPEVFRHTMEMLKPGGIMVIHENMRQAIHPDNPDHQKCFDYPELDSLLKTNAGQPTYYWASVAKKAENMEQLAKRTLVAVVQKK